MGVLSRWKRTLFKSNILSGLSKYPGYLSDMYKYSRMEGAEPLKFRDTYPILSQKSTNIRIDSHYFYQSLWAFKKIYSTMPKMHVDVGSHFSTVSLLSVFTKIQFVDIRPPKVAKIENLSSINGSILEMPHDNNSIESISSLSVLEHIGLGRYGDPLDPRGTQKAAVELVRCLAEGGNLFISLPVGKPRVLFNAGRIISPKQIIEYFDSLELVEFSGTNDEKEFLQAIDPADFEDQRNACGLFWFRKNIKT